VRSPEGGCPRIAVSVVIVNYNSWPDTLRLVRTLRNTAEVATGSAEIVLVDNASEAPIPQELLIPAPGVQFVPRSDNGGFAAGVNAGWDVARGRWLLVLNPDVVATKQFLGAVVARILRLETEPSETAGVVGFGLRNPDGSRQPSVGAFPSLPRTLWEQLIPRPRRKYQADWRTRPGPVPWVTGACMLVNTNLLQAVGGMDEDFFLYYEEVALCHAAWRAGWGVAFDPSLALTHLRPLQNRALSPKMRVITRHSKLLYFRKHLPYWQLFLLTWIVTLEAQLHGQWMRWSGRSDEARSWGAIRELARAFRAGVAPRGPAVRALAEAVTMPSAVRASGTETATRPSGIGSARKRRGAPTL
jgi:GT2 family glycosyltransferase